MAALTFEEALHVELKALTGLTTKVFPVKAPEGTAVPYVTYDPARKEYEKFLDGFSTLCNQRCYIDVFEDNQAEVIALANAVKAEITTWQGAVIGTTGPTIQEVIFDADQEPVYVPEPGVFQIAIGFEVFY